MTLGEYGINALLGKVVDFIYLMVNGFVDNAGDLSSIIILMLFITLIGGALVLMTESGRKAIKGVFNLGRIK